MKYQVNPSGSSNYNDLDFSECFSVFNGALMTQLVNQTTAKYGMEIIEQLLMPQTNKVSVHLSMVNPVQVDKIPLYQKKKNSVNLKNIILTLGASDHINYIYPDESDDVITEKPLHNSAERLFIEVLSSVQIIVDGSIVDSATADIFRVNASLSEEEMKSTGRLKSTMQLCYTLRSRRFPGFPFLRMTSQKRIFHITDVINA